MAVVELIGGAAIEIPFNLLCEGIKELITKNIIHKPLLEEIKSKLETAQPLIEQMAGHNRALDRPNGEVLERLRIHLEEGVELVQECSTLRKRDILDKKRCTNRLLQWKESFRGHQEMLQLQGIRDVQEILVSNRILQEGFGRMETQFETQSRARIIGSYVFSTVVAIAVSFVIILSPSIKTKRR